MRLTATDFHTYWRPSKCGLRVHYRYRGLPEAEVSKGTAVIYQGVLRTTAVVGSPASAPIGAMAGRQSTVVSQSNTKTKSKGGEGEEVVEVVGEPDFLIREGDGYLIRDAKMSRRITEQDHPEILRQLAVYGWLYEQVVGARPTGLQVFSGSGEVVDLPLDLCESVPDWLSEVLGLKLADPEPYSPVGWTKCGPCGFHGTCWPRAEAAQDVALLVGVDQGLATALRDQGITTVGQLLEAFDEASLAELRKPHGAGMQRVGKRAGSILRMAEAMAGGREIVLAKPEIPDVPNYVMFDLEGLPPQLDELDKVFLWGLQVFGQAPGPFQAALAGFGPEGDEAGWREFLDKARTVFDQHGDIPFVHWASYEKTKLGMYVDRYGDPDGIAERVKANLLDLLPVTQGSIALPLPSYSLKVVEQHLGFTRTLDEYGGDWAMAKYIEATEMEDEAERERVMGEILKYNEEDLAATWAVLEWLRGKAPHAPRYAHGVRYSG